MWNAAVEIGHDIVIMDKRLRAQERQIEKLRLKTAKYKALFYGNYELSQTLQNQEKENDDYCTGGFDGFCYASWRAHAEYRTLEDMVRQGIISEADYDLCNERW